LDTVMRNIAGVWECPMCGGQLVADFDLPQPKFKALARPPRVRQRTDTFPERRP